ncbi:MAG: hypothetical protein WDN67_01650 [Candidatus Moraniibacteriota bacterium]
MQIHELSVTPKKDRKRIGRAASAARRAGAVPRGRKPVLALPSTRSLKVAAQPL